MHAGDENDAKLSAPDRFPPAGRLGHGKRASLIVSPSRFGGAFICFLKSDGRPNSSNDTSSENISKAKHSRKRRKSAAECTPANSRSRSGSIGLAGQDKAGRKNNTQHERHPNAQSNRLNPAYPR